LPSAPPDLRKATSIIAPSKTIETIAKSIRSPIINTAEGAVKAIEVPHFVLCVHGRYEYRDIFGDRHFLSFRLILGGPAGVRTESDGKGGFKSKMVMDSEGNEGD